MQASPPGRSQSLRLVERRRADPPSWPIRIGLLVAVLILVFVWGWERNSDARAIARMNPAERAKLFALTRTEATALCADLELADRCRAQVDLLSHFPECDAECQAFVARHRPRAVR